MKKAKIKYPTSKILLVFIIMIISVVSITCGSLWGDEICRVEAPISGDIIETIKVSLGYAQPGYMMYIFLWSKIFGSTEFILRCSNLPFVIISIYYVFNVIKANKWPDWFSILFFCHPMFIYYMDEATPYIIVYALALAFIFHIYFVGEAFNTKKNIININLIYLLGVFIHFMFGFIIILYFIKCLIEMKINNKNIIKNHILILILFCVGYLPLGILYAKFLIGTYTATNSIIKSIMYIIYNFIGMQGIGLSRNDLRAGNFENINIMHIIMLFIFSLVLLSILIISHKTILKYVKDNPDIVIGCIVFFIVILTVAKIVSMGLWDRHCMTVFPLFVIFLCGISSELVKTNHWSFLLYAYVVLLIISSFNIRFNYYYSCDDIKGVTEEVNRLMAENNDLTVITTTDDNNYYKFEPNDNIIVNVENADVNEISQYINNLSSKCILILFEKNCSKELYDFFDTDDNYIVNDNYNSFKLVSVNDQTVGVFNFA